MLACYTHFSAIFIFFSIGAYETARALHGRSLTSRPMRHWLAAHLLIGGFAVYLYHLWQPILIPLEGYFKPHLQARFSTHILLALLYPFSTAGYVLPDYSAGFLMALAQLVCLVRMPAFIHHPTRLRQSLRLAFIGYGLGIALFLLHIYSEVGSRHTLWLAPLILPSAGCILFDAGVWLCRFMGASAKRAPAIVMIGLVGLGCATYNASYRFQDSTEYVWPKAQWQLFSDYMEKLGPRDMIVTERYDGILLENLYPFLGDAPFTPAHMAMVVPYRDSRMLFNPYYARNYSTAVFLATLQEAQAKHWFDSSDRIVFYRTGWSRSPLTDLLLCENLPKRIVAFPPLGPKDQFTRGDIALHRYAVLMIIDRASLTRDILAPGSPGRTCLDATHDMVPGFVPRSPDRNGILKWHHPLYRTRKPNLRRPHYPIRPCSC